MSSPSSALTPRAAGAVGELGLAGVGGVRAGVEARKSLFSASSAARDPVAFFTISGASMATRHSPATYAASAAAISSSVRTARDVQQPRVVVEDGQPRGLASPQARSIPT